MKSKDWCKTYLEKERLKKGCESEVTEQEVDNLLARLLERINCLTGKNYGRKRFSLVKIRLIGSDAVSERMEAKYEEYQLLLSKKVSMEMEIEELESSGNLCVKEKEKIQRKKDEVKKLNKKIDRFNVSLDELQYDTIPWDECCEDSEEEQKVYEELEECLFEILMDKIDEKTVKQLGKDMWEILEEQDREIIINILYVLKCSNKWNLTTQEFETIKFKLEYPKAYRALNEQNEVEDTEKSNEGVFIEADSEDENSFTEYLKKEQPKVYDLIMSAIKGGEIERKS